LVCALASEEFLSATGNVHVHCERYHASCNYCIGVDCRQMGWLCATSRRDVNNKAQRHPVWYHEKLRKKYVYEGDMPPVSWHSYQVYEN
jgi:hypothetical protein